MPSGAYSQCSTAPDNNATLFIIPPGLGVNEIGCYQVNLPSGPQVQLDIDTPATAVTFGLVTELYPPPTVHVSGSGFSTTYGMPVIRVHDAYGNELASVTATSATANSISAPTNDFSGVDYAVASVPARIRNLNPAASFLRSDSCPAFDQFSPGNDQHFPALFATVVICAYDLDPDTHD